MAYFSPPEEQGVPPERARQRERQALEGNGGGPAEAGAAEETAADAAGRALHPARVGDASLRQKTRATQQGARAAAQRGGRDGNAEETEEAADGGAVRGDATSGAGQRGRKGHNKPGGLRNSQAAKRAEEERRRKLGTKKRKNRESRGGASGRLLLLSKSEIHGNLANLALQHRLNQVPFLAQTVDTVARPEAYVFDYAHIFPVFRNSIHFTSSVKDCIIETSRGELYFEKEKLNNPAFATAGEARKRPSAGPDAPVAAPGADEATELSLRAADPTFLTGEDAKRGEADSREPAGAVEAAAGVGEEGGQQTEEKKAEGAKAAPSGEAAPNPALRQQHELHLAARQRDPNDLASSVGLLAPGLRRR